MEKVVVWVVIEKIAVVEVFRGANRCWVVVVRYGRRRIVIDIVIVRYGRRRIVIDIDWCCIVVVIDWCGRRIQMHCIVVVRYGRRRDRNNIDWCCIVVVRYSRRRDRNDIDWCGIVIDIKRRIQRHSIDIVIKRRLRDGLHDGLACIRRQGRQGINNTRLRYARRDDDCA